MVSRPTGQSLCEASSPPVFRAEPPTAEAFRAALPDTQCLLFDMHGVVFDDTIWSRWLFQIITRMGHRVTYDHFEEAWERDYLDDVCRGVRDYWQALRDFLRGSGLKRGQIDEVCVAAQARRLQFEEHIRALPGVIATLTQLKLRGYRLALFAKCGLPRGAVAERLQHLGLDSFFAVVLPSIELARIAAGGSLWKAARDVLQTEAERTVFVSARPAHWLEAAREGMSVIQLCFGLTGGPDTAIGPRIDTITELLGLFPTRAPHSRAG